MAAGVFTSATPAHAEGNVNWYSIGCNYGYNVSLHSNGTNFVQHTMRNTGSNSATNKFKTWNNPWWGAPRVGLRLHVHRPLPGLHLAHLGHVERPVLELRLTAHRRVLLVRIAGFALAGLFLVPLAACAADSTPADTLVGASWADRFAACMNERGWNVTVSEDGGVEGEYTDEQADRFTEDRDECNAFAGTNEELSPAEYEEAYAALLDNRDCIIAQGYDLPQPPSYQAWRDMNAAWNPFVDLPPDLATSDLQALVEACPPVGT